MPQVVITDLDKIGVISDVASFQTAPNAWTSARNVSFENGGVTKTGNRSEIMVPTPENVNKIFNREGKVYFCTKTKIYQATGIANIDISRTGAPYLPTSEWYVTELSNVAVFNNGADVPQVFGPQDSKLSDMPHWGKEGGAEKTWLTPRIRSYKSFLICLGMIESGDDHSQRIRWSDITLPNEPPPSWDATDATRSAGFNDLSEARGKPIEAMTMGDNLILYTTQEVFMMSYIGGNNIFSFRKIFDNISILSPECVAPVNGGHFVVTTSDIIIHNGSSWQSIVTDKVKRELFNLLGKADPEAVKVQAYPAKNEIWVLYPSGRGEILDRAAIYSLSNGTWTFRELPNVMAISYGRVPGENNRIIDTQDMVFDVDEQIINGIGQDFERGSLFASTLDNTWWAIDEGDDADVTLPCAIIKNNLDFDDWGVEATQHKMIKAVYPQFQGRGIVNISVGVSDDPYSAPVWSEAKYFNIETDRKVDFRETGRYISIRFEGFQNETWTLLSYAIEGSPRGGK